MHKKHTVQKIEESYKRMSKVEFITNLKGAYYRVDLRIKIFFNRPDVAPSTAEKMTSLQMCRIEKITPPSSQTF